MSLSWPAGLGTIPPSMPASGPCSHKTGGIQASNISSDTAG